MEGYKARAQKQGVSRGVLDQAFRGVSYNAEVIGKDRNQSEFKREIWDYLDSAASPIRVKNGQAALRQHARTLQGIEAKFGVEKEVVVAVWGMESTYGERRGTFNVIEALASLAYDGRRGAFFEKQLTAALQILQSGDIPAAKMMGSWAGAMGHTQFIPTSYLAYAVDFTGDGRRDIWSDDPADALASTAAYLARHGWKKGQPWGVEVRLPKGFKSGNASKKIKKSPAEWAKMGVVGLNGRAVKNYGAASVFLPAGMNGPAFLIFDNFKVISRYNNADAYVMGIGHLSDRLAGGPEIQAPWPRGYAPLSFEEKMELQRRLIAAGYGLEKVDGIIGPNTIAAIQAYQQSRGATPDGLPSQDTLRLMRSR
ncbi:MAG: lytic murein transglycosylase [Rhodobacteraceae bacterium]|nr:lytic murein transglycosylase [Paracoccaceae bacterium]